MIRTTLTTATQQRNPQGNSQRETPPISIKTCPITPIIDTARMFTARMRRISAILIMSVLVTLISACEGGSRNNSAGGDVPPDVVPPDVVPPEGGKRRVDSISVSNLRVIPNENNATLIWNNPDADIANINISYKLSTADIFEAPTPITDDARIARNETDVMGMILEGSLTPNTNYTFRVTLELKGADKNRAVMAREITRLIGPNLDGDDYADADPLETDEDGDGTNDDIDTFPRDPTLYGFAVSNLRVIPDESNATLRWNNPDADIASINISYKLSTADNFTLPITIMDDAKIARNATDVMEMITPLTSNTNYTFRVTLELKGADENKSVMAREITRLIGPNLDGDDYADDDPLETDEDGDGIDDEEDKFPRDPTLYAFAVSNLRVIPNEKNATLRWNNPDADIANINISYKLSTADNFTLPIPITDDARVARNATDVMEIITPLTPNRYYTFRVTLELEGADKNKTVMAREITRLIGPNLDGDDYADDDPLETDEDGDGIDDERDAFPRNPTLYAFAVSNLRVIPDESNATLRWNNPDADIANINISYKLSTADNFTLPITIMDDAKIARNETDVMGMISSLTPNTNYTFRVTLELKGADENKSVMAREITRLIGPNLDGDDYADDDPLETDEDGDGIDDEEDKFPRDPTLYAFAVSNLRVIPNENNATLIWNNPDADIANINISYKLSTDDIFGTPIPITDDARIARNATDVMEIITLLTSNTNYTFRVTLELEGADKNKSVMAREITRLIGPNLDGDDYADDDPLETDEDEDDTNDDIDAFPRNPTLYAFAVSNLRVIPDEKNATLRWNNPDADIASINISYKLSTDDIFGTPTPITDDARITANATDVMEMITPLTSNTNYTFRVTLELKGADENKSVIAREITRLIGPNLDGDDYADDDPLETDEDGDGIDDELDKFPRNPTLYAFAVSNLRVIPAENNATLIWYNPDADIANINISYKLSTADTFGTPIRITEDARIAANATDVMEIITSLTPNTYYTFRVTLELEGADKNKTVMAREITRLIGPNLDGDDYADDDPLETDEDGDGIDDLIDVDVDGDGLIEIATAQQLNQSRHNLLGTSFKSSAGGVGNANGCGNGKNIIRCNGYELIADIYLTTYTNWQPIGGCTTSASDCSPKNKLFNAIFDGNSHTINDLTITNPAGSYANAAGLFGAISSDSVLRNIHIRSGNLIGGGTNVALLVGYARGAMIINSSVEGAVNASGNNVGGLVGDGRFATITSSYAAGGAVRGAGINVGGLVGDGLFATITSSYAAGGTVSGGQGVGGLVGDGRVATITSSYAEGGYVIGINWVGGLVAVGQNVTITSSYAAVGAVNGTRDVGGLVGSGTGLTITSSYAAVGAVNGGFRVGGLVGAGWSSSITYSYADVGAVSGNSSVGGLIGVGIGSRISSSYATGGAVSGIGSNVGGLVGQGEGSTITSSYAAGGDVSGDKNVGGLVGTGLSSHIMSSYAAGGDVNGDKHVGGLVGVGSSLTITSSYAAGGDVSGDKHVGGLVGVGSSTITFSYGDISKSGQGSGGSGRTKTTSELITPTDASGIYSTWASDTCADGTTLAWDFGTSSDYPALNCILNGFLP